MSTFYIYKDNAFFSEFRWRLRADNNEIILKSTEGYTSKQNCYKSIASVKANSPYDKQYYRGNASLGYYFTLHAENGEPLGQSEYYVTANNRERGIETCKREAPTANVVDQTI